MESQTTPKLTKEQVVVIAQQVLDNGKWAYDKAEGLRPVWRGLDTDVPGREGEPLHLWNVKFTTPAEPFDQVDRILAIDDQTRTPICILLGPGRYDF